MEILKAHRIKYKLIAVLAVLLTLAQVSCAKRSGNIYPLDSSYYNEKELVAELNGLASGHPDFISLRTIGTTATGKEPIRLLQIQTGLDRIPILVIGQHHGDEVMGVEIVMDFARKLSHQASDSTASALLDKYSFWIVPTLNPEGWKVVTSGKFAWKRKNNTDSDRNGKLSIRKDGVDLNRNYPLFWELEKDYPVKHLYYKGSAPGSEAEVQALLRLADEVPFRYAFSYHTSVTGMFSETIYLPWLDRRKASERSAADSLIALAKIYSAHAPKDYSPGNYKVHTGATSKIGNFRNYFYHTYGTYAFDIETCGVNRYGKSIVHPNAQQRQQVVDKNVRALTAVLLSIR